MIRKEKNRERVKNRKEEKRERQQNYVWEKYRENIYEKDREKELLRRKETAHSRDQREALIETGTVGLKLPAG